MADLDSRHQAAELATALRSVLATIGQTGADHVFAVEKAQEALARFRPDGPDLTLELQGAAALILYRLNELPRQRIHQALAESRLGTCGRS